MSSSKELRQAARRAIEAAKEAADLGEKRSLAVQALRLSLLGEKQALIEEGKIAGAAPADAPSSEPGSLLAAIEAQLREIGEKIAPAATHAEMAGQTEAEMQAAAGRMRERSLIVRRIDRYRRLLRQFQADPSTHRALVAEIAELEQRLASTYPVPQQIRAPEKL